MRTLNFRSLIIVLLISAISPLNLFSQSITEKVKEMEKHTGYFDYYWDSKGGKIWLEIKKLEEEFLYIVSLPAGLGSNDIGLDRGRLGGTRIVKFQKVGPKVFLTQPNYSYRAISDNENEKKAVDQAFAKSIIWGFKAEAEENERVLIDITNFLLRDGNNVIGTLKRSNQGNFRLDASRSAIYLPMTKNFPENSEFESTLTFTGDNPGGFVRSVTPSANSITIRQHQSFVKLPDDGYVTRKFDPRSGMFGGSYLDYATPISEPILIRNSNRHRLFKKDPSAAVSEAVEPIIYYVDNGAPEPISSALVTGAGWWNQAFEAAGYRNAFQVKILPDDADPMDTRYNVINWVHRSTRGWSYGSSVSDPRTGEIIKGHVSLGSLRVRQDFLIAEGLLSPYDDGTTVPNDMQEMALARIRQLSAHEVGHTLGFSHNFAASVNGRASVMDYPHPTIKMDSNGNIDISGAYATGIGEWDKIAVRYGYSDFTNGTDEWSALNKILEDANRRGLYFVTDQNARSPGSAHPLAHLWDNGADPTTELENILNVRAKALENFSEKNIRKFAPMATLEEVLVPIYLLHRYQVEAAAKVLGGMKFYYKLRGDNQPETNIVSADQQRKALEGLLRTVDAAELTLDERILNLIPPRPPGYGQTRELFSGKTGSTFDPLTAAESSAHHTFSFILNGQRAARLVEFNARNNEYPGLSEVIDKVSNNTFKKPIGSGLEGEVSKIIGNVFLRNLMVLASNRSTSTQARAIALLKIDEIQDWIKVKINVFMPEEKLAHYKLAFNEITRYKNDPDNPRYTNPSSMPAGSPIGMFEDYYCDINETNWNR